MKKESQPRQESNKLSPSWHNNIEPQKRSLQKNVTIIGAGLAGCTTASALADIGYNVTVIDRNKKPAQGGSGNRQAIIYPRLSLHSTPLPQINYKAVVNASSFYKSFWQSGLGEQCGVIILPNGIHDAKRQRTIFQNLGQSNSFFKLLNKRNLKKISGLALCSPSALYFPLLGWLPPVAVCERLLKHPNISFKKAVIKKIEYRKKLNTWNLFDSMGNKFAETPILVLANSYECLNFSQTQFLPVQKVRGQITEIPATIASSRLRVVICGQGYLTPGTNGSHSCGATYSKSQDQEVCISDHKKNLEKLSSNDPLLKKLVNRFSPANLDGRADFRCTTPDYLPVVGAVPNLSVMIEAFSELRKDAKSQITTYGTYLPNLYIHCGLGSRGLSYAPLGAKILAAEIARKPFPLENDLRIAMHPARFIIRALKKKQL